MVDLNNLDKVGYDPESNTYHAQYDWTDAEPLSNAVVKAVSVAIGDNPADIEPLYNVVNPDALDQLFAPTDSGTRRDHGGTITFPFNQCEVLVYWDGTIVVHPADDE